MPRADNRNRVRSPPRESQNLSRRLRILRIIEERSVKLLGEMTSVNFALDDNDDGGAYVVLF